MRSRTGPAACAAAVLSMLALAVSPLAAATASREQAQALSERAAAHLETVGEEMAFADFSGRQGGFAHELYVFCFDGDGVSKAHGGNRSLVGRKLMHIKDPAGAKPIALIVTLGIALGRGWVDYNWPNPATKKIERKSAYVIHTRAVVCGVGYYRE